MLKIKVTDNMKLAEDNMVQAIEERPITNFLQNVQLKDINMTARNGRVSHLDQVYIRGSHVRFFVVPDMLK